MATSASIDLRRSNVHSALSSQAVRHSLEHSEKSDHRKLYDVRGAQYDRGETTFRVFAPHAKKVVVVLTAFGQEEHRLNMQRNSEGIWEASTFLAKPGRTYLYEVTDCNEKVMQRTDPFSFSTANIPEVRQVQSVVVDQSAYQWNDGDWMDRRKGIDPTKAPLSIYELQLKSWQNGCHKPVNFRDIAPELISYCKKMSFTHVELYGLMEHLYREARGYQVANFFAPYRENGFCDDFKYLVDQLHQNNIGVIVDWIPTHFQHYHQSGSYSVSMHEFDGTNLFAAEGSPWGTYYLDYSKDETRRLMEASALYFLDKYHVDGLRFDAISQLVHRNGKDVPAGISFLKELNDTVHASYPGVLTIAEETEGFPNVTKETAKGGLGFDLKWNIGWSHDSRNFLRTPYADRPQHWHHKVLGFLNGAKWGEREILTHSHDDTDSGEKDSSKTLMSCVSHINDESERFANLRNFFAWQAMGPSRGHMVHMGDEIAQPYSWYQRFRKGMSSVDWPLVQQSALHQGVRECVSDLNALFQSKAQLWENGEQDYQLISEYGPNAVVAYHRGLKDDKRIAVIHNFSNKNYSSYDVPLSAEDPLMGRVRQISEIFNSDHPKYAGSGKHLNLSISVMRNQSGIPTHLRVSLPANATIVLEESLS